MESGRGEPMSTAELPSENRLAVLLRQGVDALGLPVSDAQQALLLAYLGLLRKWNRAYNLSAVREPQQMISQHLLDCLAIVLPLDRQLQGREARILDVGSGAGLPGVVLAVVRPGWSVCCVDAVAKKASFIRQVAAELQLRNLRAEHGRVEALRHEAFDVVVSRAFASLADFVTATRAQLAHGGIWVAMKGRVPSEEIASLPPGLVFHVEQLKVPQLDAQRCLVWMHPV